MATLAAANPNGPRPAQVCFTYVGPSHERAWRIGDECYVPLSALRAFGWSYSLFDSGVEVTAGDRHAKVGWRPGTAEKLIPLREAAELLGGLSEWRQDSAALDVFGLVESISLKGGKLVVSCTLAAKPRFFALDDPSRVVLDLEGVRLGPATTIDLPVEARAGQFKPNVVRVAVDTDAPVPTGAPEAPCTTLTADLGAGGARVATAGTKPSDQGPPPPAQPFTGKGAVVGPLEGVADSDVQATVRIPLKGALAAPARYRRVDPCTLEITLPGARYAQPGPGAPAIASISSVQARQDGQTSVLTLSLPRPMGVSIVTMPSEVQVDLYKPAVGNGKLAGKVVVVDPGHGGKATGASSLDGTVLEKDLTLKIGRFLAEALTEEGATVILTRKTDVNLPLRERSEIANRNSADFFVSIHINSNRLANSRSGSITFHHGGDSAGTLLAECIQCEVGKASGLPSLGPAADTSIYSSGFAVLRYAKMPAVLLECGFINDAHDLRRMVTEEFQRKIAESVVRGLKVYLGDAKPQEEPFK